MKKSSEKKEINYDKIFEMAKLGFKPEQISEYLKIPINDEFLRICNEGAEFGVCEILGFYLGTKQGKKWLRK